VEFHRRDSFQDVPLPDAYERLLHDASRFTREDEVDLAWKLIDYVINSWAAPTAPILAA